MFPLGEERVSTPLPPSAGNATPVSSAMLNAGAGTVGTSIRRPAVSVRFATGVKRSSP